MAKASGNVPAVASAIAIAAGVPAGLVEALGKWPVIWGSPVLSGAVWLIVSGVLYIVIRTVHNVVIELLDMTTKNYATAIHAAISATLRPGSLNRYRRQIAAAAREQDLRGVETHDAFGPLLQDIYVEVSLDRGWAESQGEQLAAQWKAGKREPLDHFLGADAGGHHLFLVTGQPGSGKTALLRNSALQRSGQRRGATRRRARGRRGHERLPILLFLRDHAEAIANDTDFTLDIADLAESTAVLHGIPVDWLRWRLEHRDCLILLDGLDEVGEAERRAKVAAWIKHQTHNTRHQYVITSRHGGFVGTALDHGGVPLHMRAFTVAQTVKFLRNWYFAMESRASSDSGDWVRARSERHAADLHDQFRKRPALYDLASRPLLLVMIANVHYSRNKLPEGRADLYREVCEMLLKRRPPEPAGSKGARQLKRTQQSMLIRRLALHMQTVQRTSIASEEAERIIADGMARIPHPVTAKDFLDDMVHCGLLVQARSEAYEFPHQTIQEYLASAALRSDTAAEFLSARVTDGSWHEVIRLWAATSDASPVVQACLDSGSDLAIWLAFECAKTPHELDPDLIARLDQMRDEGNIPTLVKINDNLHDIVQLGQDIIVCARPIGAALWTEFLLDRAMERVQPAPDAQLRRPSSSKPAAGMWGSDAQRLVNWINEHTDGDTSYRLPSVYELSDPSIEPVVNVNANPMWADGENRPQLVCRPTVRHTYKMDDSRLADYLAADRRRSSGYLVLALAFLRAANAAGDFRSKFDGAFLFNEAFTFARLIDAGDDPDPGVANATGRLLSWYKVVHPDPVIAPEFDVDEALEMLPETESVKQLQQLSVMPDVLGVRDYASIRAYVLMLVPWLRTANKVYGADALPHLDRYIAGRLHQPGDSGEAYPEDILPALDAALDDLRSYSIVDPMAEDLPRGMTTTMLGDARRLIGPVLNREKPYNVVDVRCARLAIGAGIVLADQLSGMESAARRLRHALHGLVVLQARVENDIVPTEVLLLARA